MLKSLLVALVSFLSLTVFAQSTVDQVIKSNGDKLSGKIVEVNDQSIKFTYTGETTIYTMPKSEISEIIFASGRVEKFNSNPAAVASQAVPNNSAGMSAQQDHHNKVAILPITFIKDGMLTADAVSEKVQEECYNYLSKRAGVYQIIEPRTSNAILLKAGVNHENIKSYTMDELCKMLGCEYLVDGTVTVDKTAQTTYQSGTATQKSTSKSNKNQYSSSSYGTTNQQYRSAFNLKIYNDKGVSVYSKEKTSMLLDQNGYKAAMEYLLKRSPMSTSN